MEQTQVVANKIIMYVSYHILTFLFTFCISFFWQFISDIDITN